MTVASLLILILSVGDASGGIATLQAGLTDGLRQGDTGVVFYELTVGGEKKRIELGNATLLQVGAASARCRVPSGTRSGHLVEFKVSGHRLEANEVLRALRQSLGAEAYRDALRDYLSRSLPQDRAVEEAVARLLESRSSAREETVGALAVEESTALVPSPESSEAVPVPPSRAAEAATIEEEDAAPVAPVAQFAPAPGRPPLLPTRPPGMAEVPSGSYSIGRDLDDAKFFSEHPRFHAQLNPFWIDQTMVLRSDFLAYRPGFPFPATTDPVYATGLSYEQADAYCRSRGRTLPSETQWEAAMTTGKVRPGLLEWTSSWYQPYPGNRVAEKEYGKQHYALRGDADPTAFDPHRRRFATPDTRHPKLGFRCSRWLPQP